MSVVGLCIDCKSGAVESIQGHAYLRSQAFVALGKQQRLRNHPSRLDAKVTGKAPSHASLGSRMRSLLDMMAAAGLMKSGSSLNGLCCKCT